MSAHHPLLGIEFGEAKIRLARAGAKSLSLQSSHAISVPKNAIVKGVVQDAQTLASQLAEITPSLIKEGRECVLLIPSEIVHSFVFTLPSGNRRAVVSMLSEKLGEPTGDYTVLTRTLASSPSGATVGVVAVRKEWLRSYLQICSRANLIVRGICTAPAIALALQTDLSQKPTILVYAPSVDEKSSISIVRDGWIAQETIMSAKRGFAKIFKTATTLMDEKAEADQTITRMLVHASNDAIKSAKKLFGSTKRAGGKLSVSKALSITEDDRVYAGALVASSIVLSSLPYNLLQKDTKTTKKLMTLAIIIVGMVVASLLFAH